MRTLLCGTLLQVALNVPSAFSVPADSLVSLGDSAYARHDNAGALLRYEAALGADPRCYEAAWKAARSYNDIGESLDEKKLRKQHFALAAARAQIAVVLNPGGSKGHFQRGVSLGRAALDTTVTERMRVAREIRSEFERSAELNPREEFAWHALGRWHREMSTLNWAARGVVDLLLGGVPGDASLNKAVTCFRRAIEISPARATHHFELGVCYEKMDLRDSARAEFAAALGVCGESALGTAQQREAQRRLKALK